jgi:A/G-specific adenine glycosylase
MIPTTFTATLLAWFAKHQRDLPWKATKDPYKIWLSEIILQQTRVQQGLPYFEKFVQAYPTVIDLANASEDAVLHLWEGLGYYSRARNLHATAKHIAYELGGIFPATFKELLQLKGVGPYTASAIAAFAYNLPYAAVDGNTYRILARYFGISTPIDSTAGKKEFALLAQQNLGNASPSLYNQAMMDFGSIQCTPKLSNCDICPLSGSCYAFTHKTVNNLPVKSKRITRKNRYFNYLHLSSSNQGNTYWYIRKRTSKDIWRNLYELPLIESVTSLTSTQLATTLINKQIFSQSFDLSRLHASTNFKQQLTHQTIHAHFYPLSLSLSEELNLLAAHPELIKIPAPTYLNYAFPKTVKQYFNIVHSKL